MNINPNTISSLVNNTTEYLKNDGILDKKELNELKNNILNSDLPNNIKEYVIKFAEKISKESIGVLGFGKGLSNNDISEIKAFADALPETAIVKELQKVVENISIKNNEDKGFFKSIKNALFNPVNKSFPTPNLKSDASKVAIDTSKMSTEEKFSFYENLAKQKGGKINLTPDARNIVSLRVPTTPNANNGKGIYNDKTSVLWVDKNGNKHVEEFLSNVDPSAQYSGNGFRKDSGRIREGCYTYKVSESDKLGGILRPVDGVKVDRFRNGEFQKTSEIKNDFLFHHGGDDNTYSAGCQTFAPNDWEKFWGLVSSGSNSNNIKYTIVNT